MWPTDSYSNKTAGAKYSNEKKRLEKNENGVNTTIVLLTNEKKGLTKFIDCFSIYVVNILRLFGYYQVLIEYIK